jgi:hypothetical protein
MSAGATPCPNAHRSRHSPRRPPTEKVKAARRRMEQLRPRAVQGSRSAASRPTGCGGRGVHVDGCTSAQSVRHITDLFSRLDEVGQFLWIGASGVDSDMQRSETRTRVVSDHVYSHVAQRYRAFRGAVRQSQREARSQRHEQEICRLRSCSGAPDGLRLVHRNGECPRRDLAPQRPWLPRRTDASASQLDRSLQLHDGGPARADRPTAPEMWSSRG